MKTTKQALLIFFLMALGVIGYSQVGIGTSTPNASAVLDLSSTTSGLLPPRMTYTQMIAIVSPAEGLMLYCTNCDPKGIYYFDGTEFISGLTGVIPENDTVLSETGRRWMDRNLGAIQVATSSTDAASYGDLYQWGRATDGHQLRTSATTISIEANTAVPDLGNPWDGKFMIIDTGNPNDWLSPQDDTLWQGVSGNNNPCPSGYRLPTSAEWVTEYGTWSSQDTAGAFDSPLKLTLAGTRLYTNGLLADVNDIGLYWSSTVDNTKSYFLGIDGGSSHMYNEYRAYGVSVRCIKN